MVADSITVNASRELIDEYFWIAWYEILALSIDWFAKFKGYMDDDYHNALMHLLSDLYILWDKSKLDYHKSVK